MIRLSTNLNGSVGHLHDDGPGRPEPGLERGDPGELVAFSDLDVGAGLEEVLLHVVAEVVQELDLLLQGRGEVVQGVVVLVALEIDEVDIPVKRYMYSYFLQKLE